MSFIRTRWLNKHRPAGAAQRRTGRGPHGTYRDHWYCISHASSLLALGTMQIFSGSLNGKNKPQIMRVILVPVMPTFSERELSVSSLRRNHSKKNTVSFQPMPTYLEFCVSHLCQGHAISVVQKGTKDYTSRVVFVSLVQGRR